MPTFFFKGESAWQYDKDSGDDAKVGEFLAVGCGVGQIRVIDPQGSPFVLDYSGIGAGVGLGINIPMRIAGSKLLGMSVKKFHKPLRKQINAAVDAADQVKKVYAASEGEIKVMTQNPEKATFTPNFSDEFVPEALRPSDGIILVGAGCTTDDLKPEDFNGVCCYCNLDARLVFGSSLTAMLVGLHPVHRSRLEKLLLSVAPIGIGEIVSGLEILASAKATIIFGGASVDLGAGAGVMGYLGSVRCRPENKTSNSAANTPKPVITDWNYTSSDNA